jgi:hypothetical protein
MIEEVFTHSGEIDNHWNTELRKVSGLTDTRPHQ